jgi:hypothetical protein
MLRLTDTQMEAVKDVARLLPPWRRAEFLQELARRLRSQELIGDGSLRRIAEVVMRETLVRTRTPPWVSGGCGED